MKNKKIRISGESAFSEHYQQFCDQHCPTDLDQTSFFTILKAKTKPVLRVAAEHEAELRAAWQAAGITPQPLAWYDLAWQWPTEKRLGEVLPGFAEHWFYPLNPSSLIPVLALEPEPGDLVLDACAAPGGKAVFIADLLGERGHLVANDLSRARRFRLSQSLREWNHQQTEVWGLPAESIYHKFPNHFDKILLDAPCSSEKHIYSTPKELAKWSPTRIKKLAKRQSRLLETLWQALKPGGRLVYSTCALAPEENELVIAAFLAKEPSASLLPLAEKLPGLPGITNSDIHAHLTNSVRRIWPNDQFDPMFVAVLEKAKI